jgi:NAD+ kinase
MKAKRLTMRYDIVVRDDAYSLSIANKIKLRFKDLHHVQDPLKPELIIFVGGDGTFLRAVHQMMDRLSSVIFLGIHTGTLGFFCEFDERYFFDQLDSLPKWISQSKAYPLIEMVLKNQSIEHHFYAVNEVRIENPFQTFATKVEIDHIDLESFRGTGLVISSTLGSSAYNKSLGGAVVDHDVTGIQLTEMATIQNQAFRALGSPLFLSPQRTITLKGTFDKTIFGYDHLLVNQNQKVEEVVVRLSQKKVSLVHHIKTNFISSIKKNFIG